MTAIKIEIRDEGVMAAFNRLIAAGEDPSPVMRLIGERLAESTKERFERSVSPSGQPWKPLAKSTYAQLIAGSKRNVTKKGRLSALGAERVMGRKPLVKSGILADTITYQLEGQNSVLIGTPMEYGFVHQFGGAKTYTIVPRIKKALWWPGADHPLKKTVHPPLPARPFLGVSAEDESTIEGILREAINGAWGGR